MCACVLRVHQTINLKEFGETVIELIDACAHEHVIGRAAVEFCFEPPRFAQKEAAPGRKAATSM